MIAGFWPGDLSREKAAQAIAALTRHPRYPSAALVGRLEVPVYVPASRGGETYARRLRRRINCPIFPAVFDRTNDAVQLRAMLDLFEANRPQSHLVIHWTGSDQSKAVALANFGDTYNATIVFPLLNT